ncbi:hypothetical protein GCM10010329_45120 [Streptomyces spiroverticillatus]|nr:hypothetical protein GCM10010329_45120 [Streptomyces spiroverticillatus]
MRLSGRWGVRVRSCPYERNRHVCPYENRHVTEGQPLTAPEVRPETMKRWR